MFRLIQVFTSYVLVGVGFKVGWDLVEYAKLQYVPKESKKDPKEEPSWDTK